MGFADLSEFFDPDLHLPIRGTVYRIPCESAHDKLRLQQIFFGSGAMTMAQEQAEAMNLLGATWETHTEQVPVFDDESGVQETDDAGEPVTKTITVGAWAGGVYQQMADDGLSIEEIMHAGMTALNKAVFGREHAENYWATKLTTPGDEDTAGKAPAPRPAEKRPRKTSKARSSSRASTAQKATTGGGARTAKTTPAAATTTP